jgi:hypothetical protein
MADKFSDAANRRDGAMFLLRMLGLRGFFVQFTAGGVVKVDGDRARARFYVQETARSKEGRGNYNLSMYEDELVKTDGEW